PWHRWLPTWRACDPLTILREDPPGGRSGQRRPASIRIAAGRSTGADPGAAGVDRMRVLPAILRPDPIGLRRNDFAVTIGLAAFPGHRLAAGRIFKRPVFRLEAAAPFAAAQ